MIEFIELGGVESIPEEDGSISYLVYMKYFVSKVVYEMKTLAYIFAYVYTSIHTYPPHYTKLVNTHRSSIPHILHN